jgi:GDP-D-mannose 3', 5'-epimerase
MCKAFHDNYGIETRVGRYHNIYGRMGTWDGGREKAPAAICRKVAEAKKSGHHEIEIWGDGKQTRSFMHIDDCVHSTQLLASSDIRSPLNLGSSEMVTIDQLVDIVEEIAGIKLTRKYNTNAPKGVRGRSSDNTLTASLLNWTPSVRLSEGMTDLYQWIDQQINECVTDAA